MRYTLAVEVKLIEVPEAPELPEIRPGSDPLQGAVAMMTGTIGRMTAPPAFMGNPAGFDFRKQIQMTVPDFRRACEIVARFDDLATDIEHDALR